MKIKEWLSKIRLAELQDSLKIDQLGLVSVRVENNTFILPGLSADQIKEFKAISITPQLEAEVKRGVEERLSRIEHALGLLSSTTVGEVVAASTLAITGEVWSKKT